MQGRSKAVKRWLRDPFYLRDLFVYWIKIEQSLVLWLGNMVKTETPPGVGTFGDLQLWKTGVVGCASEDI